VTLGLLPNEMNSLLVQYDWQLVENADLEHISHASRSARWPQLDWLAERVVGVHRMLWGLIGPGQQDTFPGRLPTFYQSVRFSGLRQG
jgi:hypothetical protein